MQTSYLRAIARGDMRRALDGSPAGLPTDEQRDEARQLLAAREAKQAREKLEKLAQCEAAPQVADGA